METQTPQINTNSVPESQTLPVSKLKNNKPLIVAGSVAALVLLVTTVAVGSYVVNKNKNESESKSNNSVMTSTVTPTATQMNEYIDADTKLTFKHSNIEKVDRVKNDSEVMIAIENTQTLEKLVITQLLAGVGGMEYPLSEVVQVMPLNDGKTEVTKVFSNDLKLMRYIGYSPKSFEGGSNKFGYGTNFFPNQNFATTVALQNAKDNKSTTFDALVKTIRSIESPSTPTPVTNVSSTYNYSLEKPNFTFKYNSIIEFETNKASQFGIYSIGGNYKLKSTDNNISVQLIDLSKNKVTDNTFSSIEEYFARNYSGVQSTVIEKFTKETVGGKTLYYGDATTLGSMYSPKSSVNAYGVKISNNYYLVVSSRDLSPENKERMKEIATSFTLK